MITAGVDLAAEPARTAVATIAWSTRTGSLTSLHLGVNDEQILDTAAAVDKLGIECPLGWPEDFLRFVNAHHTDHVVRTWPERTGDAAWHTAAPTGR